MFALPPEAGEPEFVALFEYWCRQAPSGQLPGRQHLDPIDMPRDLLPWLVLFDIEPALEGPCFRTRLIGTKAADLLGRAPRGAALQQLGLAEAGSLASAFKAVVTLNAPVVYSAPLMRPNGRQYWARRLCLPLAGNGYAVDMVIGSYVLREAALAGPAGLVVFNRLEAAPRRRLGAAG
ncbi:PAS domain-containing protein [Desertibaculum subflavum]|uniref:PAS domain-containing protein n=1 Tax=Desertibaculum subflavum TaxID=2268458 RepID=UPI000E6672FA